LHSFVDWFQCSVAVDSQQTTSLDIVSSVLIVMSLSQSASLNSGCGLLGRPTYVGRLTLLNFLLPFSFFFFFFFLFLFSFLLFCLSYFHQYTTLSSHMEDCHQMYSGGSVVGKASFIDPEIVPTPAVIFTGGGAKSAQFGLIFLIKPLSSSLWPSLLYL